MVPIPAINDAAEELRRAFHTMDDAHAERAAHLILQLAADSEPAELSYDDESILDRAVGELAFFKNLPENVRRACAQSFSVHREKTQTADISSVLFEQGKAVKSKAGLWVILCGQVDIRKVPGVSPVVQEPADATANSTVKSHEKSSLSVRHENSKASLRSPEPRHENSKVSMRSPDPSTRGMLGTPSPPDALQPHHHARAAPDEQQSFGSHSVPTREVDKLGELVAVLRCGNAFGEDALVTAFGSRSATAVFSGTPLPRTRTAPNGFLFSASASGEVVCIQLHPTSGTLPPIRNFLTQQLGPTFYLRPVWCREALRKEAGARSALERARVALCLDALAVFGSHPSPQLPPGTPASCDDGIEDGEGGQRWGLSDMLGLLPTGISREFCQHSSRVAAEAVLANVGFREFPAGAVMQREGDAVRNVMIVVSGYVSLHTRGARPSLLADAIPTPTGVGVQVGVVHPGEPLLEHAPWFQGEAPASAVARTPTEVLILPLAIHALAMDALNAPQQSSRVLLSTAVASRTILQARVIAAAFLKTPLRDEMPVDRLVPLATRLRGVLVRKGTPLHLQKDESAICLAGTLYGDPSTSENSSPPTSPMASRSFKSGGSSPTPPRSISLRSILPSGKQPETIETRAKRWLATRGSSAGGSGGSLMGPDTPPVPAEEASLLFSDFEHILLVKAIATIGDLETEEEEEGMLSSSNDHMTSDDVGPRDWFGASSMAPLPGKKGTMFFSRGSAVVAIIKDKDFIDAGCLRRGTSDVLALDRVMRTLEMRPEERGSMELRQLAHSFQDHPPFSLVPPGASMTSLLAPATLRTFLPGEHIALQNGKPTGVWLILTGTLLAMAPDADAPNASTA
ncbi:hypothetical protein T484DRAFT_1827468 [Baffinella frigidus]|nr:hypothetical protein T484DRAFT_1827468 [Cryptophyta sp. CCMP2293]